MSFLKSIRKDKRTKKKLSTIEPLINRQPLVPQLFHNVHRLSYLQRDEIDIYNNLIIDHDNGKIVNRRKRKRQHDIQDIIKQENDEEIYFREYLQEIKEEKLLNFVQIIELFVKNSLARLEEIVTTSRTKQLSSHSATFNFLLPTSEAEAIQIYEKYLNSSSSNFIRCPDEISREIYDTIRPNSRKQQASIQCFNSAQKYAIDYLENNFYTAYLNSSYHAKYLVFHINKEVLQFFEVVEDEHLFDVFVEFMKNRDCDHLIEAWKIVAAIRKNSQLSERKEEIEEISQEDLIEFYDEFFSLQGVHFIPLPESLRLELENGICQETMDYNPFLNIFDFVENVFNRIFLSDFKRSHFIYKYIDHLLVRMHQSDILLTKQFDNISLRSDDVQQNLTVSLSSTTSTHTTTTNTPSIVTPNCPTSNYNTNNNNNNQKNPNRVLQTTTCSSVRTKSMTMDSTSSAKTDDILCRSSTQRKKEQLRLGRIDAIGNYISDVHLENENDMVEDDAPKNTQRWQQKLRTALGFEATMENELACDIARKWLDDITRESMQINTHYYCKGRRYSTDDHSYE
ncbi:hypothetical protein SNEBB_011284 [Seison nebaliae]|nr:hypothetical protein SNEBB_011284 [Seison nebaliae]